MAFRQDEIGLQIGVVDACRSPFGDRERGLARGLLDEVEMGLLLLLFLRGLRQEVREIEITRARPQGDHGSLEVFERKLALEIALSGSELQPFGLELERLGQSLSA